jgi:hypothetical protein
MNRDEHRWPPAGVRILPCCIEEGFSLTLAGRLLLLNMNGLLWTHCGTFSGPFHINSQDCPMKRLLLLLTSIALAGTTAAATFSVGGGQGVSIVDAAGTGDYTSLADAAQDFSSYAPGCTGDWTLLIRSDLTEPNNVAFGNDTNGHKVTMKPAPSTSPVITFTTTTRPATGIWDAALCIGTSTTLTSNVDFPTTTSNFTIDGSNTEDGTSRDMTIRNTPGLDSTANIVCRVVCGSANVAFKNLIVDNLSSGTSTTDAICIEFTSRRADGIDYHPTNGTVTNCLLRARSALHGMGIMCRASGTIGTGRAQTGMMFSGNTIEVNYQAISAGMNDGVTITHNAFDVYQSLVPATASNGRPTGVYHAGNQTTGWDVVFTHNKFLRYGNVNWPFVLPQLVIGAAIVSPQTGTYEINNNFFGGFEYPGTATIASQQSLRSIQIMGTSGTLITGTYNIYHNSFNNPDIPQINGPGTTRGYDRLVPLSISSPQFIGTVNFMNNIVRFEQHNGVVFYLVSPNAITFNADHNIYYLGTLGAKMATWNVPRATDPVTHPTFESWQAAGFDTHSRVVNPAVADEPGRGVWVSNSDLHFDGDPGFRFAGVSVGIATDIDGEPRTVPVIGADELPLNEVTAARDWALFQ